MTRMSPAPLSLSLTSLLTSIESSIARPDGRGVTIGLMSVSSPSDSMLALTGGTTTGAVQCQNVSLISSWQTERENKNSLYLAQVQLVQAPLSPLTGFRSVLNGFTRC